MQVATAATKISIICSALVFSSCKYSDTDQGEAVTRHRLNTIANIFGKFTSEDVAQCSSLEWSLDTAHARGWLLAPDLYYHDGWNKHFDFHKDVTEKRISIRISSAAGGVLKAGDFYVQIIAINGKVEVICGCSDSPGK